MLTSSKIKAEIKNENDIIRKRISFRITCTQLFFDGKILFLLHYDVRQPATFFCLYYINRI